MDVNTKYGSEYVNMDTFMASWNPSWEHFPWKQFTAPSERFQVETSGD